MRTGMRTERTDPDPVLIPSSFFEMFAQKASFLFLGVRPHPRPYPVLIPVLFQKLFNGE